MAIRVSCERCFASFKVRDTAAGKKIRCPDCREPLRVPEPEDDKDFLNTLDDFGSFGSPHDQDAPPPQRSRSAPKKKKRQHKKTGQMGEPVSPDFAVQVIGGIMLLEVAIIGVRLAF